ncbi:MAG TPA: phosphoadenylyl-sulfate reductase [Verrucomicrobiae bacterium]|nr:phosphoadenylyl-sulfate reductase [Verrucomicrobiae bacterium]
MLTHKFGNIEKLNADFEGKKPQEIVAWAIREFAPKIAMTSSFGPESGTLLHMVSRVDPATPILFLETGYHFPETLEYRDKLAALFGLKNVVNLKADPEKKAKVVAEYNGVPYEKNPDLCCQINKVEPMGLAVKGYDAWMSGIRRHQTDFRKAIQIIEEYEGDMYKISPLANFTSRDSWWYMKEHQIPQHPLYEKGYLSIGCWPCTKPVQAGDDERSGRWAGKSKTECGIHTFMKQVKAPEKEKDSSQQMGEGV